MLEEAAILPPAVEEERKKEIYRNTDKMKMDNDMEREEKKEQQKYNAEKIVCGDGVDVDEDDHHLIAIGDGSQAVRNATDVR